MICPYCVEDVPAYSRKHTTCSVSENKEFPPFYLDHHGPGGEHEPLVLSVIGFSGHGKTVFLCALFHYIDHYLTKLWPGFFNHVLDQESLSTLNLYRERLEAKILPQSTPRIFPRPGIFRLTNMPCVQECDESQPLEHTTVLIYDPPGEAFSNETNIVEFARFVKRSDCVLFLIDLTSLNNAIASQMAKLLDTYVLGMRRMKIKSQHLIVVYTKSDEMKVSVPQFSSLLAEEPELEAYLKEQLPPTLRNPRAHLRQLDKISRILEDFTQNYLHAQKFINEAAHWFASVSYTAVSSLGAAPEMYVNEKGETSVRMVVEMSPRCVADPLLYVLSKSVKTKLERPPWWQRFMAKAGFTGRAAVLVMLSGLTSILLALVAATYFLFFYNAEYRQAVACAQKKDYACAIENYTKAIEASPEYVEAYNGRGWAYLEQGNYEEALKDCSKAGELKADFAEALTCRGMASVFSNAYDAALADCAKAVELKPEYAEAYLCRGITYWYQKENAQAVEDYSKAIKLDPNFARAYFNRGSAHADSGNVEQARSDYQRAAELAPELTASHYYRHHAFAYNHRGRAFLEQAKYADAIADFDKAIGLKRDYAEAYENLGTAYAATGNYQQSIKNFSEAVKLQPDNVTAHIGLGDAYFYRGAYDQAVGSYSNALELRRDYAEVYVKRGDAFIAINKCEQAIRDYESALKFKPRYVEAHFGLGDAYLKKGNYLRDGGKYRTKDARYEDYHWAVKNYDAAAKLRPGYARAVYNRGIANALRENYVVAIRDYEEAIAIDASLASEANASYGNAFSRRAEDFHRQGDGADSQSARDNYYGLATKDYQQALKLNPNNASAQNNLARLKNR